MLLAIKDDGRVRVQYHTDEVLAQRCISRSRRLRASSACGHEEAKGLSCRGQVKLGGDNLKQLGDTSLCILEELGPRNPPCKVNLCHLTADLKHQLGRLLVDIRPGVLHPSRHGVGPLEKDAYAALLDIFETQDNLIAPPRLVVANGVRDEALLKTLEVKVSSIAKQLLPVRLVTDMNRIPAQEVQQLCKRLCAALGDRRREDRRWADEALAVEAREQVVGAREEGGEAEGEEVGRVPGVVEDLAGDLKLSVADADKDALFVELRDKLGHCAGLCQIGYNAD